MARLLALALAAALAAALTAPGVSAQPVRSDTLAAAPPPDAWLGRDKALHAGLSLALTVAGHAALAAQGVDRGQSLPAAAGVALGLGLFKELHDRQRPVAPLFSWRDLAADALGVAVGVALGAAF